MSDAGAVQLNAATHSTTDLLADLVHLDGLGYESAWSLFDFRRAIADDAAAVYTAVRRGERIGFLVAAADPRGHRLRLLRAVVHPSVRRRGLFRRLVALAAAEAEPAVVACAVPQGKRFLDAHFALAALGFRARSDDAGDALVFER